MAAVLFTDIVASTSTRPGSTPRVVPVYRPPRRHRLATLKPTPRPQVKTMGDGFLATFGASGRAIRCAADIVDEAKSIGLDLRVGIHTGEVEVRGDDIAGLALTIAKRVCDLARPMSCWLRER